MTLLTLPALTMRRMWVLRLASCYISLPILPDESRPVLQGARTEAPPTAQLANTTLEQPGQLRDSHADLPNAPTHPVVGTAQCDWPVPPAHVVLLMC